jgi:hypothetical protein
MFKYWDSKKGVPALNAIKEQDESMKGRPDFF